MKAWLYRIHDDGNRCLGVMSVGTEMFYTLERPWLNNKPFMSCIPKKTYVVRKVKRPSGKIAYHILNVENRTKILIHPGNDVEHSSGCILPGFRPHSDGVLDSRRAMHRLLELDIKEITIV